MIGNLLRVKSNELESYIHNSELLEERIDNETGPELLDIDKTWEGILYILTGYGLSNLELAKPPLKWVIIGDNIVDENQDLGYGPAEFRTHEQVKEISSALELIFDIEFRTMFQNSDISMREDIYPGILWPEAEDAFHYHFEYFKLIKEFYAIAAKNNEAVISFIN